MRDIYTILATSPSPSTHEQYISVILVIFALIYCLDVIFKITNNNFIIQTEVSAHRTLQEEQRIDWLLSFNRWLWEVHK